MIRDGPGAPESGEGAANKGGRFNPVGIPALYLALSVEGMLIEIGYGFGRRFDPLTICAYHVDVDDIVDLRSEQARAAEQIDLAEMSCPWAYDRASHRIPASWSIARALIVRGAAGILAPSFADGAQPGMTNLVLWRWGPALPHLVQVIDPQRTPAEGLVVLAALS